jgi:hypothetical protein
MESYTNIYRKRVERHDRERYTLNNVRTFTKDFSCPICHNISSISVREEFITFWRIFTDTLKVAQTYNKNTVQAVLNILILDDSEILNEDSTTVMRNVDKVMDSIRYEGQPEYTNRELTRIIRLIVCVVQRLGSGENDERNLRKELKQQIAEIVYGQVIGDDIVDRKFTKFLE